MGNCFSEKPLSRDINLENETNNPLSYRNSQWFIFSNKKEKYGICKTCIEKSPCQHVFWNLNTGLKKFVNAHDIVKLIGDVNFEIIHI